MEPFVKFAQKYGAYMFQSKQSRVEENGQFTQSFFQLNKDGELKLYVYTGQAWKQGELVSETVITEESFNDQSVIKALEQELIEVTKQREVVFASSVESGKQLLSEILVDEVEGVWSLAV